MRSDSCWFGSFVGIVAGRELQRLVRKPLPHRDPVDHERNDERDLEPATDEVAFARTDEIENDPHAVVAALRDPLCGMMRASSAGPINATAFFFANSRALSEMSPIATYMHSCASRASFALTRSRSGSTPVRADLPALAAHERAPPLLAKLEVGRALDRLHVVAFAPVSVRQRRAELVPRHRAHGLGGSRDARRRRRSAAAATRPCIRSRRTAGPTRCRRCDTPPGAPRT